MQSPTVLCCIAVLDFTFQQTSALAQVEQADALSRLAKAIIAFILHGQGEDTIDEYGDHSEDE